MYCSKCGIELEDQSKFCNSCGLPTTNTQVESKQEDIIKCPKCLSAHLTANQKGYNAGKALGGAVLTGGIGLLAGFHGSKDVMITCMACGHSFKAGEGIVSKEPINKLEGLDLALFELIQKNEKLLAMKACREGMGLSISEANDYLNKLASENGLTYTNEPSKSGCAGVLIALITIGGLLAFSFN